MKQNHQRHTCGHSIIVAFVIAPATPVACHNKNAKPGAKRRMFIFMDSAALEVSYIRISQAEICQAHKSAVGKMYLNAMDACVHLPFIINKTQIYNGSIATGSLNRRREYIE